MLNINSFNWRIGKMTDMTSIKIKRSTRELIEKALRIDIKRNMVTDTRITLDEYLKMVLQSYIVENS